MEPAEFKEVMKEVKALQRDLARSKRELEKESKESKAKACGEHDCA
jgi:sialic acid synthase SpsE